MKYLSQKRNVHIHWISSPVNVTSNEITDILAKKGSTEIDISGDSLTYNEISSVWKSNYKQIWLTPPDHHWYCKKSPSGIFELESNRSDITAISRQNSGHPKEMTFSSGCKIYTTCNKCHVKPASLEHIIDCLGLGLEYFTSSPFLVMDIA